MKIINFSEQNSIVNQYMAEIQTRTTKETAFFSVTTL